MSLTNYQKVAEFNVVFDCPQISHIEFNHPSQEKVLTYRCDLIREEGVEEFGKALNEKNRIEMIDAICDSLYVLYGAAWTMQIDVDYHFKYFFDSDLNTSNFNTIQTMYIIEDNTYEILNSLFTKFQNCEIEFRNVMLSGNCEFDKVVTLLIKMIEITYKMGHQLNFNVDKAFNLVHESNMSKVCKTEEEAQKTVYKYKKDYENGVSPYNSPYYYNKEQYYVVKNESSGKVLKSINYNSVDLSNF